VRGTSGVPPCSTTGMVDYREYHESQQLLLQTVDEESESEQDDEMQDDVRSSSSTLKSTSQPAGWGQQRQGAVGVAMTESTDSGLESDKNVDTELTTSQNNNCRQHRNENLLYHCQVGLV